MRHPRNNHAYASALDAEVDILRTIWSVFDPATATWFLFGSGVLLMAVLDLRRRAEFLISL